MKLRKVLAYREYWGDRIAWKIGNVVGDDYDPGGVIDAGIEVGDYGIFTGARTPAGTYPERQWLSLSVGVTVWRWGAWIAVRGRKVRHADA
ncbi:hypothetical protein TPA4_61 [Tsukamurella phage TPA4]|uniref:hypothetical protein n=1 Tax=Tsukamurella phage TPA4 TaxID=1647476 RepID=UPI0007B6383D|nr:hypothetical protein BH784_gp61 [Tsukamurella phage TPA4]AKJ72226.1 hypothetical protein TPA4_61 [Tsukamurella phage TPA4]